MGHAWETRAKLLAAARRAFAELGYAKARVEDIVTRAGVGHGTFYAYFPNKQAALAALMREHAGALEELASQPWRAGDVRASLAQVLGGLADLYDRDADMVALWTEAAAHDPELAKVLDEVRGQFVARVARNVERAQAQGVARPVDAFTAAVALAAMAEQTLFLRAVRREPLERGLTVETLADLWYHALYKDVGGLRPPTAPQNPNPGSAGVGGVCTHRAGSVLARGLGDEVRFKRSGRVSPGRPEARRRTK